ncbi:MAG: DciA family protein [Betaproteobacteria bacterium]
MIPRRMQRIVTDDPTLAALWDRTRPLRELQKLFATCVPPYLRSTSRVGSVAGDELKLFADSGAAATRLRLLVPELLAEFRSKGWQFNAIRVAVQVRASAPTGPAGVKNQVDTRGRQALQRCADQIADSPLRAAIERLSRLK